MEFEYKVVGHNSRFVFYIDNDVAFEDSKFTLGVTIPPPRFLIAFILMCSGFFVVSERAI